MSQQTYFILGTDTDCGKTYVTCQLVAFAKKNYTTLAIKPIASGCPLVQNQPVSGDVAELKKANQCGDSIGGWQFVRPISPHLAAKDHGVDLSIDSIAQFCQPFTRYERLFIEGAGGLMVPLNESDTWIDFLKRTQWPVILVVGMRLGCINHALLTASTLAANTIHLSGWIANRIDPHMLAYDDNVRTLVRHIHAPMLAEVGFSQTIQPTPALHALLHGND